MFGLAFRGGGIDSVAEAELKMFDVAPAYNRIVDFGGSATGADPPKMSEMVLFPPGAACTLVDGTGASEFSDGNAKKLEEETLPPGAC